MHSIKSPEPIELQQQQLAFAAYIRDPQNSPPIRDVAEDRMTLYQDLFYNNIDDTLSSAFPILKQVLDNDYWQQLCQQFFANHHSSTPYLSRLPGEFVNYLIDNKIQNPPWLIDLAQWEWAELDLFLAADADCSLITGNDVINDIPVLSPLVRLHEFDYPVHRISAEFLPDTADQQKNYLLAWRKADDSIGFMQANAMSVELLKRLQNNKNHTGQQLLAMIAATHTEHETAIVMQGGSEILQSFYDNNIVLGTRSRKQKDNV